MEALAATNSAVSLPIFRPLTGIDKDATVEIARRIGTFEVSILPYEDCCTVFVAKHPKTRPSLSQADEVEKKLDINYLVEDCINKIDTVLLKAEDL